MGRHAGSRSSRPDHPGAWSTCPGRRRSGSGPMTSRFAVYHAGHASAISASDGSGPRCRAAMDHSESPRRTTTSAVLSSSSGRLRGAGLRTRTSGCGRVVGAVGTQPGSGAAFVGGAVDASGARRPWWWEDGGAGWMRCRRCEQPPRGRERSGTGPGVRRAPEGRRGRRSPPKRHPGPARPRPPPPAAGRVCVAYQHRGHGGGDGPGHPSDPPGDQGEQLGDHGEGQPGRDEQREHGDECRQGLVGAKVCSRLQQGLGSTDHGPQPRHDQYARASQADDRSADGRLMLFRDICMRLTVERRAAARKRWVLGCGP